METENRIISQFSAALASCHVMCDDMTAIKPAVSISLTINN